MVNFTQKEQTREPATGLQPSFMERWRWMYTQSWGWWGGWWCDDGEPGRLQVDPSWSHWQRVGSSSPDATRRGHWESTTHGGRCGGTERSRPYLEAHFRRRVTTGSLWVSERIQQSSHSAVKWAKENTGLSDSGGMCCICWTKWQGIQNIFRFMRCLQYTWKR